MKRFIFISLLAIPVLCLVSFKTLNDTGEDKNYDDCIEKYDHKWGLPCGECGVYNDSFTVYVKNTCDEAVDLQIAVQNTNKKWQVYYKGNMAPSDTLVACACKGNGKWLYWTRKAGDREIEFYNEYQINSIYKD